MTSACGPINWGDAPTWVAAAAAIVAGIFAVRTFWSQKKQLAEQTKIIELESRELRALAEERKSAQARRVRIERRYVGDTNSRHVYVTNGSDSLIRDVQAYVTDGQKLPAAMPLSGMAHDQDNGLVSVVMPQQACSFTIFERYDDHAQYARVTFTDEANISWDLSTTEGLKPVEDAPQNSVG